jgi:hypothetical protein
MLPSFAVQGFDMTPPLLPRAERALERVAPRCRPARAWSALPHGLEFHPASPRARAWRSSRAA